MIEIIHNPYVWAALVGAASAARVDYLAFQSWTSANEALAYDWKIAAWRWFQGAVIGVVSTKLVS